MPKPAFLALGKAPAVGLAKTGFLFVSPAQATQMPIFLSASAKGSLFDQLFVSFETKFRLRSFKGFRTTNKELFHKQ